MIEQLKNLPACLRLDFGCALLVASVPAHEESLVIQKKLDDRLELLLFEFRTMHRKTKRRLVDGRLGEVGICTFFKESLCAVISACVHGAVQRSLASLALRVDGSRGSCFEELLEIRGVGFLCSFHQVLAARRHAEGVRATCPEIVRYVKEVRLALNATCSARPDLLYVGGAGAARSGNPSLTAPRIRRDLGGKAPHGAARAAE